MSYQPPPEFEEQSKACPISHEQKNLELLLIRVPKKFDISALNGVEYVPGQIKDIEVDETLPGNMTATYQLGAFSGQDLDVAPLVSKKGKEKLILGDPVSGILSVTKTFSIEASPLKGTQSGFEKRKTPTVPMPEGLRERFTPFGAGHPVSTPNTMIKTERKKRGRDSTASSEESPDHKRKRRKKDIAKDLGNGFDEPAEVDSAFVSPVRNSNMPLIIKQEVNVDFTDDIASSKKHKKKHKKDRRAIKEAEQNNFVNGTIDASSPLTPVPKHLSSCLVRSGSKKKKNVSFSNEDCVFMDSSGDASRLAALVKQECLDESNNISLDAESSTRRKKKRKHSSGYSTADTSLDHSFVAAETESASGKKKKKKKNIEVKLEHDSCISTEQSLSLLSTDHTVRKEKKKKKHKEANTATT